MESRLPKPTKSTTKLARVPGDRLNAPTFSKFSSQNRHPISMDIENVRNALNVPQAHGSKRQQSPDGSSNLMIKRPKLRRSFSASDITIAMRSMQPNLATIPANSVLGRSAFGINRGVTKPIVKPGRQATETRNGVANLRTKFTLQKTTTTTAAKATGKMLTSNNTKPAANGTAASKPAVKRVAPYDFKTRFQNLQEKHTTLREKHERLLAQLGDLESMPEQYEECKNKLRETNDKLEAVEAELETVKHQNSLLETKVSDLTVDLENTTVDLTSKLEKKTEEFRVSDEKCQTLAKRNSEMTNELEECKVKTNELSEENENLHNLVAHMKDELFKFNIERKGLHNIIMDLRGNIRVFCRIRPPLALEADRKPCTWQYFDETSLEICMYSVYIYVTPWWSTHRDMESAKDELVIIMY